MNINLIAAVGDNGQIGLDGKLPWARDDEDMKFFYNTTQFGILIMGARTAKALNWQEGILPGRRLLYHYHGENPAETIGRIRYHNSRDPIWICGGTYTYRMFMPYVRRCYITRNRYNGPADATMPPLWGVGSFE